MFKEEVQWLGVKSSCSHPCMHMSISVGVTQEHTLDRAPVHHKYFECWEAMDTVKLLQEFTW